MSWKAPRVTIEALSPSQWDSDALCAFQVTTRGFSSDDIDDAVFVFVHACPHTSPGGERDLTDFMVVPCQNVRQVHLTAGSQTISFEASFYQRAPGTYHLIAWVPSMVLDGHVVNNATVFEKALAFGAA